MRPQTKFNNLHWLMMVSLTMSSCTALNAGAAVPIKINAYGIHFGGQIVYRYQIQNNSSSIIYMVNIGIQTEAGGTELPGLPWSLNPNYSDIPVPLALTQCKPFVGMDCMVSVIQFEGMPEPKTLIDMEGVENNQAPRPAVFSNMEFIRPGTLSSVAELTVPPAYQSMGFLTASGEVFLLDSNTKNPDGSIVTSVEIPFTKVDVTPPTLSVSLSPYSIPLAQRGQIVPITATITVSDDYDPAPEIKLELISANEVTAGVDIQNEAEGTDDRSFSLKGAHTTTAVARIYTVTYSATDASGNTSTATATVTAF